MRKREILTEQLKPILHDVAKLEKFLVSNSNLPGPRANLELIDLFADLYDDRDVMMKWSGITEKEADVNNPRSFLTFCATVGLGKVYTESGDTEIIDVLKKMANDGRWRVREAVAFAFQRIGEHDFETLMTMFSDWIKTANNLEKRAILVSLAHPKMLNKENVKFCFDITEQVLQHLEQDKDFEVLYKGLAFTISVFAAANTDLGFKLIRKWIGKSKVTDRIMKENLKKNRLIKKDPKAVEDLLKLLSI